MKSSACRILGLILLFLWVSFPRVFAEEMKKQFSKRFDIESDTKIEISNKHGNVIINNWDENVLDIKVTIVAEGKNDANTKKILDAISIDMNDNISSGRLKIATEIGDEVINKNSKFSILYEVNMPKTNPLKISNIFGNVYMGSQESWLEVAVKYGQFQAEDLNDAKVRVEFSNAKCEVEGWKSGSLDLRYSKMTIEDAGDLVIASQFSDLEIENARDVRLDGKYGEFTIENINSLTADIQFAGLSIEQLGESLQLATRHGNGIKIDQVSNEFKEIRIDSEFSSLDLNLESGATAILKFDLNFCNLKTDGEGINFTKVVKENSHSAYEGYLKNASSNSSVSITAKHGNVRLDVD